jgi:homoserine O-acetyltransferase
LKEYRERWWPSATVKLGRVVRLALDTPFVAEYGGELSEIQASYESWGTLNTARDNAIVIIHPMTADCHATGDFAGAEPGWWEPLIGPGRALDTDRFHVVCPNLVGGCYGTTGPRFPAPDGKPYLDRFPLLTPRDMARFLVRFLDALGIARAVRVIGPSLGGMIAWEWAVEAPERVGEVIVVAAPLRTSPHQIGLNWLQRRGIELDITEDEVTAQWGQMVARGVGMLSYRSPTGLEEKFGREWFQEPGATLRERGMFNIESWLRHHGKRIVRRFDPYTYLLYSRAMDLHDLSRGRGDLVSAMDRISCRVQVIGISSDYLYPPAEVHLGADILRHLGKDVRYAEIRSPHGHDAFLLDTGQIASFLRESAAGVSGVVVPGVVVPGAAVPGAPVPPLPGTRVPTVAERAVRPVRVGILGAGRVAAAFTRLVRERGAAVSARHGLAVEIRGVAEIDRAKALDAAFEGVAVSHDPETFVSRGDYDVLVDLTRGSDTRALVEKALGLGRHVVTPNKSLLRTHGESLERVAFQNGVRLAYHDSIAAGWPLIHALERPLSQGAVMELQAVLSSACNVVLEQMEEGRSFALAVAEAARRDLFEPDPDLDLSGWDSAEKLKLLLARATGWRFGGQNLAFAGILALDPLLIARAPQAGYRIKLVALARRVDGRFSACVRPLAVPRESHLGLVRGDNNVVVLHSSDGGEMVYLGTGAGALPVATAVLNDLIGVFDPSHSWTGRFPAYAMEVGAPEFVRWLALSGGTVRGSAREAAGSVPVL